MFHAFPPLHNHTREKKPCCSCYTFFFQFFWAVPPFLLRTANLPQTRAECKRHISHISNHTNRNKAWTPLTPWTTNSFLLATDPRKVQETYDIYFPLIPMSLVQVAKKLPESSTERNSSQKFLKDEGLSICFYICTIIDIQKGYISVLYAHEKKQGPCQSNFFVFKRISSRFSYDRKFSGVSRPRSAYGKGWFWSQ